MAAGGDYADYQFLHDIVQQRVIDEECLDDGISYTPKVGLETTRINRTRGPTDGRTPLLYRDARRQFINAWYVVL